jgi:coatomer subunit beta'
MLYTATGDRFGVLKLAEDAVAQGKLNIAFVSFFILGEVEKCFELLIDTDRIPEATLLARTYLPSHISRSVSLWREDLKQVSERAAAALADPAEYPNLFPDIDWALKVEDVFKQNRSKVVPASEYPTAKEDLDLDLIALVKEQHNTSSKPHLEPVGHDMPEAPSAEVLVDRSQLNQIPSAQAGDKIVVSHVT